MVLRIAVVGPDRAFGERVVRRLHKDVECIASLVPSGRRFAVRSSRPHLFVIDHRASGALALCSKVAGEGALVVVTNLPKDQPSAVNALAAGARGVVCRGASVDQIVGAVRTVRDGKLWAPRDAVAATWAKVKEEASASRVARAALVERLSRREQEVLRQTAIGLANKEVAARLAISEATVKVHLTHIFQKLGVRGRGELVAAYYGVRS